MALLVLVATGVFTVEARAQIEPSRLSAHDQQSDLDKASRLRKAGKWVIGLGVAGSVGTGVYAAVVAGASNSKPQFAKTYLPFMFFATATVATAAGLFGRARQLEKGATKQGSITLGLTPGGVSISGRF
ncbi:MAG: hypothetical protein WBG86_07965 [Polyangiales bacterium]